MIKRISILILSLSLALPGCGDRHSDDPPSPARPVQTPAEDVPAPDAVGEPALDPESIEPAPGWPLAEIEDGDEFPWWMLIGLGAVKPAEEIEEAAKLCGKFFDLDGTIKLVQTRTRGQRTYPVRFLDPKYALETHYCFKGVFKRYKVLGGPDVTIFEITDWADDFVNHANAREADGLPPRPRKKKSCDEELLRMTEDPSPYA